MPSKEFVAEMKLKLLEAKSKLEEDLASLKSHEELGEDIDSSVQEVEGDDLSRGLIPRMKADLEKIGKALAKIEAGTYGTDDDGKEISEARLEALPWADKAI
ncbi:MAG TPA: TraR/DksA C4-type zinc finger protein [Candidatus Limnocylindria bacterium]|nr:TraR/DksA C4-type zinc finger protein [Candidatus Limnocylindria bacterium]